MNPSTNVPDPTNTPDADRRQQPTPALDATVEMERPKDVSSPIPGDPVRRNRSSTKRFEADAFPTAAKPAAVLDATIEMARPADLKPVPSFVAPQPPVAPKPLALMDATVEMERPQPDNASPNKPPASPNKLPATTPKPLADLNATVEMERPGAAKVSPVPATQDFNATVEIVRSPEPKKSPLPMADVNATEAIPRANIPAQRSESPQSSAAPVYAKKLGEVLVQMGKLTPEQVDEAVSMANEAGERIGRWLLRWELVTPDVLCRALSTQTELPMTTLDDDAMPEALRKMFPLPLMMHHGFVPFEDSGTILCLAACNPLDQTLIHEQEKIHNRIIEVFLAREDHVARQLDWLRIKLKTRSRHHLRFPLKLTVTYQFCNRLGARLDKDVHTGSTINISEGGYLLEGPATCVDPSDMLRKGLFAHVTIKSMTGEIPALCDVREIRLVEDGANPRWLLGVEIVEINPDAKTRLKALCRKTTRVGI